MIQETKARINFQPYYPEKGRQEVATPYISVNRKRNSITFPAKTLDILGLDGKFIAFYFEPVKKIIGWTIKNELSEVELQIGKYRLVKPFTIKGTKVYRTTITGIIQALDGRLTQDAYKHLEVKRYVEKSDGILTEGETYYYVELNDQV